MSDEADTRGVEPLSDEELLGAIARGWCTDENAHKNMDPVLAAGIASEVRPLLDAEVALRREAEAGQRRIAAEHFEMAKRLREAERERDELQVANERNVAAHMAEHREVQRLRAALERARELIANEHISYAGACREIDRLAAAALDREGE